MDRDRLEGRRRRRAGHRRRGMQARAPARGRWGAGSRSEPSNRVDRCHTFGVASSTGSGSQVSSSQEGPRTSATASTTIACSSRSFAEAASASPFVAVFVGIAAAGGGTRQRVRADPVTAIAPRGAPARHPPRRRDRWASRTRTQPGPRRGAAGRGAGDRGCDRPPPRSCRARTTFRTSRPGSRG